MEMSLAHPTSSGHRANESELGNESILVVKFIFWSFIIVESIDRKTHKLKPLYTSSLPVTGSHIHVFTHSCT